MNVQRWAAGSFLLGLGLTVLLVGEVAAQGKRQYYGDWAPSGKGYQYCYYYFKPAAGDAEYKHHYAICYPSTPRYIYFYNPEESVYWGRYDCHRRGYSMLPVAARKNRVFDIGEKAFPPPAALPVIPQAKDGATVAPPPDLPPADLPPG